MLRRMTFLITALMLMSLPVSALAQRGRSMPSIDETLDLLGKAIDKYPTLSSPAERLYVDTQMIGWLSYLRRDTKPPAEVAAQMAEMQSDVESRREDNFEAAMVEAASIMKAVPGTGLQKRRGLVERALYILDALLANTPPSKAAVTNQLRQMRDRVAGILLDSPKVRGDEPSSSSEATVDLAKEGSAGDSSIAEFNENGSLEPDTAFTSDMSPADRVMAGLTHFVTVLLGAAIVILFGGPVIGVLRWAGRAFVPQVKGLWNRYNRVGASSRAA